MFREVLLSPEKREERKKQRLRKIEEEKGFSFYDCEICQLEFQILTIRSSNCIIPNTEKKNPVCMKCEIKKINY